MRTNQIPAILEVPVPYRGQGHRATGVLCPGCAMHEIVYNGNYFCADESDRCRWALPHYEPVLDPETGDVYDTPPAYWDLVDMLVRIGCAGGRRGSHW